MIQYSKLGIMQGRLSPPFQNNIQHFPINHWQEEIQSLADLGLGCLEWVYEHPTVDQNPLHFSNRLDEIMTIAFSAGIRVNTVIADYFMVKHILAADPDKQNENISVLENLIDHCAALEIPIIELPFVDSTSLSKGQFNALVEVLKPLCDHAQNIGIKISLETDLAPQDFKQLLEMFTPNYIYVNHDMGNSASLGFDPGEEIETLGPYIINVHIKDRLLGGTTVPLGTGDVDFERVFSALKQNNYHHDFILQAARQDIDSSIKPKTPQETIEEYLDFLEPWIADS